MPINILYLSIGMCCIIMSHQCLFGKWILQILRTYIDTLSYGDHFYRFYAYGLLYMQKVIYMLYLYYQDKGFMAYFNCCHVYLYFCTCVFTYLYFREMGLVGIGILGAFGVLVLIVGVWQAELLQVQSWYVINFTYLYFREMGLVGIGILGAFGVLVLIVGVWQAELLQVQSWYVIKKKKKKKIKKKKKKKEKEKNKMQKETKIKGKQQKKSKKKKKIKHLFTIHHLSKIINLQFQKLQYFFFFQAEDGIRDTNS
eukprot:TRINITY_DN3550_c0_g1_i1.p4 TRINITY_DN3550_c0_g1~~TRINITY_DN3550_c0_g1_i1.p4  ORF type:complete len:255 (+),score=21.92 TRINITY_DN3550_c0_g1_i1:744-1508(+)